VDGQWLSYVSTIKESQLSGTVSGQVNVSPVLVINFDTVQIESRRSKSKMKGGGCQDNTAHSNWTTIGKSATNLI
jgi:hypothetical protein